MPRFTAAELAKLVEGRLEGESSLVIDGLETVEKSGPEQLTFIGDDKHAALWKDSRARVVMIAEGIDLPARDEPVAMIRVPDADHAMITVLGRFERPNPKDEPGIHPTAVVHEGVTLGREVSIGPHCTIEEGCTIGDHTTLLNGVTLRRGVEIGASSTLHPGVVIQPDCTVGSRTTLHANVVIGTDGFGYRPAPDGSGLVKIPHVGTVLIGDDVEIGASTCIDRGKFGATRIGDGTKLDNLCQIGHNCEIGRSCILCGQVGVAGSTVIGDGTQIGGGAGLADHLKIGRGVTIGADSGVINDIPDGETWLGTPAGNRDRILREHVAIRRLPEWSRQLRKFMARGTLPGSDDA